MERVYTSAFFQRYDLLTDARTVPCRFPCGTTGNICLKSPPKSIVLPPKGLSAASGFAGDNKSRRDIGLAFQMLDGVPLELHPYY